MRLSWLIAQCAKSTCNYAYDIRAPAAADLFLATSEGRLRCIKCGGPVTLQYPRPEELMASMGLTGKGGKA